jgi:hypothetical protein
VVPQRFGGAGQTGEHANSLGTHSLGIGVYAEDFGVAFIEAERGGEICMWHVSKAHVRYASDARCAWLFLDKDIRNLSLLPASLDYPWEGRERVFRRKWDWRLADI